MALHTPPLPTPSRAASSARRQDTTSRIHALWQQNLPVLHSRLDRLASAAANAGTLSAPEREEAISIAHKLAGSLGLFGFPEGTVLASRLEEAFAAPATESSALTQLADQLRASLVRTA